MLVCRQINILIHLGKGGKKKEEQHNVENSDSKGDPSE